MTARVAETDLLREAVEVADRLLANIETVVHGKRDEIRLVLTALACNGHVLFEDVPGTAKTVLARAVSQSIEGAIGTRIQCTPDLQPTDVTGLAVYDQRIRDFEFRPGPIFANVILVDEINRAMPKTQSALLEAMAERQVTVDGTTRAVPRPFLLLATENPIEYEGTFPLPEAQLDRFFLRTSLGYPSAEEELQVIGDQRIEHPLASLRPIVGVREIETLERAVASVHIDPLIAEWIVALVRATREMSATAVGASVRGSLALERAVRGWALLHGRDYVVPTDVERLFVAVLGHRVVLTPTKLAEARQRGMAAVMDSFADECLSLAPPPVAELDEPCRRRGEPRMIGSSLTFPLVSRRRLIGLAFGSMHGARRGSGSDIAGSRPYVPGDDPHRIDWAASGRLSAARATDEFVVREYFADEAPRAVVCVDRRPAMALCPPGMPFLHKDAAAAVALELIEDSVAESRGLIGLLETDGREGVVGWCPPASGRRTLATVDHELHAREASSGRRHDDVRVPHAPSPRGSVRELRLRPLGLHRADAARDVGVGASTAAGTSCPS